MSAAEPGEIIREVLFAPPPLSMSGLPAPPPANLPRIVALVGPSGVGKSTAAQAMGQLGYERDALAWPIKLMLEKLLHVQGVSPQNAKNSVFGPGRNQPHAALNGKTPRQALQHLGTEFGRDTLGTDYWVDALLRRHEIRSQGKHGVRQWAARYTVVDDVRFPNEAHKLRAAGGVLVRIAGFGPDKGPPATHSSELSHCGIWCDFTVVNDWTTREEFQAKFLSAFTARFSGDVQ